MSVQHDLERDRLRNTRDLMALEQQLKHSNSGSVPPDSPEDFLAMLRGDHVLSLDFIRHLHVLAEKALSDENARRALLAAFPGVDPAPSQDTTHQVLLNDLILHTIDRAEQAARRGVIDPGLLPPVPQPAPQIDPALASTLDADMRRNAPDMIERARELTGKALRRTSNALGWKGWSGIGTIVAILTLIIMLTQPSQGVAYAPTTTAVPAATAYVLEGTASPTRLYLPLVSSSDITSTIPSLGAQMPEAASPTAPPAIATAAADATSSAETAAPQAATPIAASTTGLTDAPPPTATVPLASSSPAQQAATPTAPVLQPSSTQVPVTSTTPVVGTPIREPQQLPTATATATATAVPTNTSVPTGTSVPTSTPTGTSVPTSTPTGTSVPTFTPTETSVPTSTPAETSMPTSTPNEGLAPTSTPTGTSVPTSTPTQTSAPTPSATPTVTLPICTPVQRPNDIAIVLDRSGSIEEAGALEEVRSATQYLIDRTDLQTSQISLVTFNDSAQVAVPLSQDREALTGALVELTATGGTNIAAGVTYATLELSGNRRNPDAQPVIVLLSDGLARGDDAEAIVAAKLAKQQGIRVITIGLGANVNVALLQEMASAGDDFYLAPTKEDLALIYERITDTLVCEPVGT